MTTEATQPIDRPSPDGPDGLPLWSCPDCGTRADTDTTALELEARWVRTGCGKAVFDVFTTDPATPGLRGTLTALGGTEERALLALFDAAGVEVVPTAATEANVPVRGTEP